jgi:hypothetical protein
MRKFALLAFVSALAPQVVTADVVRHSSLPKTYRGTWAPSAGSCKNTAKSAIVLSAKAYKGPAGSCTVKSVSKTPGGHGSVYSAHLQCSSPGMGAQKKTIVNLIIRPDSATRISAGPSFHGLKVYQRCSANQPSAKQ